MDNASEETYWDIYSANVDGDYSLVLVNMDLIPVAPIAGYKFMGFLGVNFLNPKNGFYHEDELKALDAIEGQIMLISGHDAIYAGRKTGGGTRDYYFYAKDQKIVEKILNELMKHYPEYKFIVGSELDEEWKAYTDFLYPNEMGLNEIANRPVHENLMKNGNISSETRICDHFILFNNKAAVTGFIERAKALGFHTSFKTTGILRKKYDVNLQREDAPTNIDSVTLQLKRLAAEFGGEYDGWETFIVRE